MFVFCSCGLRPAAALGHETLAESRKRAEGQSKMFVLNMHLSIHFLYQLRLKAIYRCICLNIHIDIDIYTYP